jgi:hypothetical protein
MAAVRYCREIEVATPTPETFAISRASRTRPSEIRGSSRLGDSRRRRPLHDGERIALRREGDKARSDDVVQVSSSAGGTRMRYEADLRLKGVLRIAEPFLRSTFRRMGDDALDGLAARLARGSG